MASPLTLGFAGFGPMARNHYRTLTTHSALQDRVRVVAAFDPDPGAQSIALKHGLAAVDAFDDLLAVPGLAGIVVASPPQFHAAQAIAALESGLNVFSEVPMALEGADVRRLVALDADGPGVTYMLGENYCFLPEVLYAGHLARTGAIGPVVYAESEYLHDVTYRWRQDARGDVNTPRVDSWYSLFDPLAYGHSIGPAQVAMGGLNAPPEFVEVQAYANDIGGYQGSPACRPAKAFHVALFRTATGAIAKCANAYHFAREPTRLTLQVVGRVGTYECYQIGKKGRLFAPTATASCTATAPARLHAWASESWLASSRNCAAATTGPTPASSSTGLTPSPPSARPR